MASNWRPPDYEEYPEFDPHSENIEVFDDSDEESKEQRQIQEEMDQHPAPDELIGHAFSDKTSSEETGNEKDDWITKESKSAKTARKLRRKLKLNKKRRLNVLPMQDYIHS